MSHSRPDVCKRQQLTSRDTDAAATFLFGNNTSADRNLFIFLYICTHTHSQHHMRKASAKLGHSKPFLPEHDPGLKLHSREHTLSVFHTCGREETTTRTQRSSFTLYIQRNSGEVFQPEPKRTCASNVINQTRHVLCLTFVS